MVGSKYLIGVQAFFLTLQIDKNPQGTMKVVLSDKARQSEGIKMDNLSYCCNNITCKNADPMFLNWPVESQAVNIATFIKDRKQTWNNTNSQFIQDSEEQYYTKSPEYVVVKISHAFTATDASGTVFLTLSNRKMVGYLTDINGNQIKQLNSG